MKKTLASLAFTLFCLMILTGCRTTPPAPPRVSILGDSYSTFKGWIPDGNAIYTRKREAITT